MLSNVLGDGALVVDLLPEHHDVALGRQVAAEDAVAGSDDGAHYHGLLVLPDEAGVDWDENDPEDQKQQHAIADQLGVFVQIRQPFPFVRTQEAAQGHERDVDQHSHEEADGTFLALHQDGRGQLAERDVRRIQQQPGHAHAQLQPERHRHHGQRLVEPLGPGAGVRLEAEARQDLQQVGQDAGDAQGEGQAKDGDAYLAGVVAGHAREAEGDAEAHQQGEELHEAQVAPHGLHDGRAAVDGEDNGEGDGDADAEHADAVQGDFEGVRPPKVHPGLLETAVALRRGIHQLVAAPALLACKGKARQRQYSCTNATDYCKEHLKSDCFQNSSNQRFFF